MVFFIGELLLSGLLYHNWRLGVADFLRRTSVLKETAHLLALLQLLLLLLLVHFLLNQVRVVSLDLLVWLH